MMTRNDQKFAETLTALSFDEDDIEEDYSPRRSRKWLWSVAVLSPLLIAGSLVVYRPDIPQSWGIDTEQLTLENLRALPVVQRVWPNATVADSTPVAPAVQTVAQTSEPATPAPVALPIAPPVVEITGSGYVTAAQSTSIFSPLEGRAAWVAVAQGDWVEAGQELLQLEGDRERFALESAQFSRANADLALAAAAISLEQAQSELDRKSKLVDRGAIAATQLDDAQVELMRAQNTYAQAQLSAEQADLSTRIAEHEVSQLTIRAPFTGRITSLDVLPGDMVAGQDGPQLDEMALMTLVNTQDLTIEAEISETNIAAIRDGVRGEAVLDAYPDQPFDITLDSIAAVASAQKGTITLRFTPVNPPEGTRPNMAVRIRIVPTQQDDTLAATRSN